jgi:hypothetical protein
LEISNLPYKGHFFCLTIVIKKIVRSNMEIAMNKKLKSIIILKFGTQADFAQSIGEYQTVVSEVVRGRRQLSDHKELEWAMALGCHTKEIFPRDNEASSKSN